MKFRPFTDHCFYQRAFVLCIPKIASNIFGRYFWVIHEEEEEDEEEEEKEKEEDVSEFIARKKMLER